MKVLLVRIAKIVNDRLTRVLFYDQTLKKGYASHRSFSKFSIIKRLIITVMALPFAFLLWIVLVIANRFIPVRIYRFARPQRPGRASYFIDQLEPLCRGLQAENVKAITIFLDAGAITNVALSKIYEQCFSLYYDDRKPFFRRIFSLIPKIGFRNTAVPEFRYNLNWELPRVRNRMLTEKPKMPDFALNLKLEPLKYITFSHPSFDYYSRIAPEVIYENNIFIDLNPALKSLEFLIESGFNLVRVGAHTDPLPKTLMSLPIIDLSGLLRDDEQDLWLFENCFFHWSMGGNGAWWLARKFDRPSLSTDNYKIVLGNCFTFYTFESVWDEKHSKFLSVSEMLKFKGIFSRTTKMAELELSYIQNSPEQLFNAVSEVVGTLRNGTAGSRYDQSLLDKYDEIILNAGHPPRREIHTRPCLSFLESIQEQMI